MHSACSRRQWLQTAVCGVVAGHAIASAEPIRAAVQYEQLSTEDYLGTPAIVASVSTPRFFTEGPAWDGHRYVYFTNVYPNQICRFDVTTSELSVFRENSNAANGLAFAANGTLLACEGGRDDRGRLVAIDPGTGDVQILVDNYRGAPLGAPNDLAVDARGRIYFTSRLSNTDPQQGNVNAVYRRDPDGTLARILAFPDIDMPNGIAIAPDQKSLYLVESDSRADRSRCIRAYDLQTDGSVANARVLIDFYPGRSGDGMCLDVDGNLYVAAGLHATRKTSETLETRPGIHVVTPQGKLAGFVATPEDTITNCCFGGVDGKTLYVTCSRHLLAIPAKRRGAGLPVS